MLGQTVSIQRVGGGASLPAGMMVVFDILGVRNRLTTAETSTSAFTLFRGSGERSDVSRNVSRHLIRPGTLGEATVSPSSHTALAKNVEYTLRFRLAAVGLPTGSRIVVAFPPGINLAACALVSTSVSGTLFLSAAGASSTLVSGPRRSLSLKLTDTRVYEPQIRARLGTTVQFCKAVVLPCINLAACALVSTSVSGTLFLSAAGASSPSSSSLILFRI